MVRWSKRIQALSVLSLTLTAFGRAQSTTLVQISVPNIRDASPGNAQDAERYVRNISSLSAAVLEVNRTSLRQPIDLVVICGNTDSMPQDPKIAADLLAGLLGGLSPNAIFLAFDHPASLDARWSSTFLTEIGSKLPDKKIIDFGTQVAPIRGIGVGYAHSVMLMSTESQQRDSELKRLAGLLASGPPTILFTTSANSSSSMTSGILWPLDGDDKTKWSKLLQTPKLLAVFVGIDRQTPAVFPTVVTQKTETGFFVERHIFYPLPSLEEPYDQTVLNRGIMLVSLNAEGRVETRPILLFNRFTEEQRDLQDVLIQAGISEKNREYATAFNLYGDALKSKDPEIRNSATAGLHRTDEELHGRWERLRRNSIALDWIAKHWVDISLVALLVGVALGWLYFRNRSLPVFRSPVTLNDGAPSELFILCVFREIKEIRDVWQSAQSPKKTESGYLSLGEDVPKELLEDLPKLIGENPASAVKVVFFFWRYFSWRVESSVYGTEENAAVYVRVCWGWKTKASWVVPDATNEPMGIRECAEKIAYNLSAEGVLKG